MSFVIPYYMWCHGALCNVQEMADLDVDEIMAKQVEQLEKEKKELQERLKGQEKKVGLVVKCDTSTAFLPYLVLRLYLKPA
jgi:hypothetical protein